MDNITRVRLRGKRRILCSRSLKQDVKHSFVHSLRSKLGFVSNNRIILSFEYLNLLCKLFTMEWKKANTLFLLQLIRERPVIWDASLEEHKNKHKRLDALSEIGKIFNVTKEEINSKWLSLKGQYNREKRKLTELKMGSGADDIHYTFQNGLRTKKWLICCLATFRKTPYRIIRCHHHHRQLYRHHHHLRRHHHHLSRHHHHLRRHRRRLRRHHRRLRRHHRR